MGSKIYKYIPLKYLIILLESKQLLFKKVSSWEDSYENLFLKQTFVNEDGDVVRKELIDLCFSGLYGQCWTDKKSSDAMWRIYSQLPQETSCVWDLGNTAIRIETDSEKLTKEIRKKLDGCGVELDGVSYKTEYEIKEWLNSLPTITRQNMTEFILESIFIKRIDFQHESEIRIIIHRPSEMDTGKSCIHIPVNPIEMINEFVLDPRLTDSQCEMIMIELTKYGVEDQKIRKSRLYDIYKTTLVVDAQS